MKPVGYLILIKADKQKTQTDSGIFIQEDWKSLPPTGTVLAIGDLVSSVKPGDRVMFERYGSVVVDDDDRLCREEHILAVLDGTED